MFPRVSLIIYLFDVDIKFLNIFKKWRGCRALLFNTFGFTADNTRWFHSRSRSRSYSSDGMPKKSFYKQFDRFWIAFDPSSLYLSIPMRTWCIWNLDWNLTREFASCTFVILLYSTTKQNKYKILIVTTEIEKVNINGH